MRTAAEAFQLAAQEAHDDLTYALAGDADEAARRARLSAWRQIKLRSLQKHHLAAVEGRVKPDRLSPLTTAFARYLSAVERVGQQVVAGPGHGDGALDADSAFDSLRTAAQQLVEDARVSEHRRRGAVQLLTILGSGVLALVASTGIVATMSANLQVRLVRYVPQTVSTLMKDPAREVENLGRPVACTTPDLAAVSEELRRDPAVACARWTVLAWRALPKGVVLAPNVKPASRVRRLYAPVVVGDSDRIETIAGETAGFDRKTICVNRMEPGDVVHLVAVYEPRPDTKVLGADATMAHLDTSNTCGKFPF